MKLLKLIFIVLSLHFGYQYPIFAQGEQDNQIVDRVQSAKTALQVYLNAETTNSWKAIYALLYPDIQKTCSLSSFESSCETIRKVYPMPVSTKIISMKVVRYNKHYLFYGAVSLIDNVGGERLSQFVFLRVQQKWRLTLISNSVAEDITMKYYLKDFTPLP